MGKSLIFPLPGNIDNILCLIGLLFGLIATVEEGC
jgi:hypothetical protein